MRPRPGWTYAALVDPNELLTPAILVPIAVVVVLLLGAGIAVFTVLSGKKGARSLQQWTRGAYSMWTGGEDSGTWTAERAQKSPEAMRRQMEKDEEIGALRSRIREEKTLDLLKANARLDLA